MKHYPKITFTVIVVILDYILKETFFSLGILTLDPITVCVSSTSMVLRFSLMRER